MRGMEDAIADPDAASQTAVDLINANGNENFLSPEGEQFRWRTESELVTEFTPEGEPIGLIDPAALQAQLDAYDAIGIFTEKPPIEGTYDEALIAGVYGDDGKVVWPGVVRLNPPSNAKDAAGGLDVVLELGDRARRCRRTCARCAGTCSKRTRAGSP